jgi:hypothetical protein
VGEPPAGRLAALAAATRGASVCSRALDLLPTDHSERGGLLIGLAHAAYDVGEYRRSSEAAQELIRLGREHGDARLEWRGRAQAMWIGIATDPTLTMDEVREVVQAAIPVFEEAGDGRAWPAPQNRRYFFRPQTPVEMQPKPSAPRRRRAPEPLWLHVLPRGHHPELLGGAEGRPLRGGAQRSSPGPPILTVRSD